MEYRKTYTDIDKLISHTKKVTERGGQYRIEGMTIIYSFNVPEDLSARFFKITYTENDKWGDPIFLHGENHQAVMSSIDINVKRVLNPRFREIEVTGKFYSVEEQRKYGKTLIFEKKK